MLEIFIYFSGAILVLMLGIIFMVIYDNCDIEYTSIIVVGASALSWITIMFVVTGLTIIILSILVYKITTYIKTKKGL